MVFKDLDFLGWYTTGDLAGTVDDMKVHRQVCHAATSDCCFCVDMLDDEGL